MFSGDIGTGVGNLVGQASEARPVVITRCLSLDAVVASFPDL